MYLLALVGQSHYYLVKILAKSLTISLTIGDIISTKEEITISFSKYDLYKIENNFWSYYIAKIGS